MTWDKENISIRLLVPGTCAPDTTAYELYFQPADQAYPAGAVAGAQGTVDASCWQPSADLDTDNHYDVVVVVGSVATAVGRLLSKNSNPPIGG